MVFMTTKEINIDSLAFPDSGKLNLVYFNKSVKSINGLPSHFGKVYSCRDNRCGCSFGYCNIHDAMSDLYTCKACKALEKYMMHVIVVKLAPTLHKMLQQLAHLAQKGSMAS